MFNSDALFFNSTYLCSVAFNDAVTIANKVEEIYLVNYKESFCESSEIYFQVKAVEGYCSLSRVLPLDDVRGCSAFFFSYHVSFGGVFFKQCHSE